MTDSLRKVCYISGTRADFGLMASTLIKIHTSPMLSLGIIVTGMHLSEKYGFTVQEIEENGLIVEGKVDLDLSVSSGDSTSRNIGKMVVEFTRLLASCRPEILLLLGDRGEMLAGAIAALHLNIPIAHIHGGERSGTLDEPIRHAISKLSHIHFVATEESAERLIRMGELDEHIWVTGAPGLDGIREEASISKKELSDRFGFCENDPIALLLFHPVPQNEKATLQEISIVTNTLQSMNFQVIALMPNSDSGADNIRAVLGRLDSSRFKVVTHLPRKVFLSLLAASDLLIGNSSSGIIEAASFGLPVINLGCRQNFRERNLNVMDVEIEREDIMAAVERVRRHGRYPLFNLFGDGNASERISSLLSEYDLDSSLLNKINAY